MRLLARLKPWWPLALVFAATLALELALAERKYGLFGGGFGASHVVDRPGEILLFVPALLAAHALLIGLLYAAIRALHWRRRDSPVLLLNFLFFSGAGLAALLVAKFEALSYFSDALGLELIENLGGGSLATAMLYVASDAALAIAAALGAIIAWWIALRLARRYLPERVAMPRLGWRRLLCLALPLPFLLAAGAREPDARYALARFTAPGAALLLLDRASDVDQDGYSWFSAQRDVWPFDPARHPLALDVPGNGVDEDGYGGDFLFRASADDRPALQIVSKPRHVVLIVLESVRVDAIGRRVAGRPVTPVLNGLARQGSWIREAYSHVGFTTASGKSIFGGALDPQPGDPSIFRDLKASGYRIGVFSAAPENFGGISETVGMRESADIFVDAEILKAERAHSSASLGSLALDGKKVLREFDRHFTSGSDWARPTFLYFNFQEAHFPYHHRDMPQLLPGEPVTRGEIKPANRERVAETYWNAVAYDDWLIGQVIARLKRMGVYDRTLLAVTADHGESLFDDGFLGHGHMINRQQTRIPFILNAPGIEVKGPIGLSDYRSILLRALGADLPEPGGRPVFLHIGPLDAPTAIGTVEAGGRFTVMQLETDEVSFSESGFSARYSALRPGSRERARADRLVNLWARQRWIAHLGRR